MLRRSIAVYCLYFAQFLKSRLAYRWDFLASILANLIVSVSGLLFVLVLMTGGGVATLKGWTLEEVLFLYGYSMVAMAMFTTFAPNLYRFSDRYIIQGQFDRVLLRPLNSLFQVLFESFNLEAVGGLSVGLVLITYSSLKLRLTFSLFDCLWFVVSGLCGGVILLSVFIFLASLSFHFEDRLGVAAPVFGLISFARYPLPIFNEVIQFILRWVVPFAFVAFYPATHFLGRHDFAFYCYFTPVMAIITGTVAWKAWEFGVSRYASTGN